MFEPIEIKRDQLIQRLVLEWDSMKKEFTREQLTFENYVGLDVKIQVPSIEGELSWCDTSLHIGTPDEDSIYSGFWGFGILEYDWKEENLKENIIGLVDFLFDEVKEDYAFP